MKNLLKRIALWALYYLAAAALVAFLALKYSDNVVLLSDSWFPAAYAAINTLLAVFYTSKLGARFWIRVYKQHEYVYRNRIDLHFSVEREHERLKEDFRTLRRITLAITPIFFVYIPFFSVTAKHFCGFFLLLAGIIYAPVSIYEMHKLTEEYSELVKKEREEQERREELGKWK